MRTQQKDNRFKKNIIICIGDSQSDYFFSNGVRPSKQWPTKLSQMINAVGGITQARCFANQNYTSAEVLGKADIIFLNDDGIKSPVPAMGVIYCGINDLISTYRTHTGNAVSATLNTITLPGTASPAPNSYFGQTVTIDSGTGSGQTNIITSYNTSTKAVTVKNNWATIPDSTSVYTIAAPASDLQQANQQAIIKVMRFKVTGQGAGLAKDVHVYSQTQLPALGNPGQRYVVMSDTSTTGGASQNGGVAQHPNITGNYSVSPKQSVWEFRNEQAGELGWARVAIDATPTFAEGIKNIIIVGNNYWNFAGGIGDVCNTVTGTPNTKAASGATVRQVTAAAATAEGVIFCDLFDFQSKLLYGTGNSASAFGGALISAEDSQNSNKWHTAPTNLHHNEYGHTTVARAIYLTIASNSLLPILSI